MSKITTFGVWIALNSIFGSCLYYFTHITTFGLLLVLALSTVCLFYPLKLLRPSLPRVSFSLPKISLSQETLLMSALSFLSITSLSIWWATLFTHQITDAVRSPWTSVSPLLLLTLLPPLVTSVVTFAKQKTLSVILLSVTLFSALAFAAVIYPLGYGFDPFLHRATVSYILEHGTITPKPLYYIGEYALELLGTKIFHFPLHALDAFLVPALLTILLPATIVHEKKSPFLVLLFLPLFAFVQTTPQALAFLFTALAIFTPKARGIFAVAALFAHPLAGIPIAGFALLKFATSSRVTLLFGFSLLTLSLPAAFLVQALMSGNALVLHLPILNGIVPSLVKTFQSSYNIFGDITALFTGGAFLLVVGIAGISILKHKQPHNEYLLPLLGAGATFVSFFLISACFSFDYLIPYERTDFALRLITLTTLFLLPYVADITLKDTGPRTQELAISTALLFSFAFLMNVYAAYPRDDAHVRSTGFNVSLADFAAVDAMEAYAGGRDYVVLSNQATSAAAVEKLSFKKYYPGDIFFYPIPTSGKLYALYLQMVESPSKDIIDSVRELTGAPVVYFAVSDYWWNANVVRENAKAIANHSFTLENGKVTVFVFENL